MNGKIPERDEVIEKEEVEHVKLRRRVSIGNVKLIFSSSGASIDYRGSKFSHR